MLVAPSNTFDTLHRDGDAGLLNLIPHRYSRRDFKKTENKAKNLYRHTPFTAPLFLFESVSLELLAFIISLYRRLTYAQQLA